MKKLFQGVKTDMKFKAAGPGHRLNEQRRDNPEVVSKEQPRSPKPPPEEAQIAAASAAMTRLKSMQGKGQSQSKNANQIHVTKPLESHQEVNIIPECKNMFAPEKESTVCNILFRCPLTGEILRKEEKESHMRKSIELLSHTDPITASIMKIYTLNKDQAKVKLGIETITKYLDNIIASPNEEKYRTIRFSNKVFQERIKILEGSLEFFGAVGFEKMMLPLPGQDVQDEFYVLSSEAVKSLNNLQRYRDSLLNGQPIRATLERQPRIFAPSLQATQFSLTDDFYNLTVEEIKQEHQLRKGKLERESLLRTKAMREREEKIIIKKYKYTVLRVRFPDGYLLQGTFYAQEWLSSLFDFVCQHLQKNWLPYDLLGPCGQKLENKQVTFYDCDLVPSALLTFSWDPEVLADVEAAEGHKTESFLKQELVSSAETLH
ncbi:UBX domain-containing protein 6 isoform X1 [Aquarana catesbeiana]|uniref:UBX domain-containing protein 6 isoform X1 n=1 Tax=Aquarana catesbeiana TaxID=8400 RepID=UPI003CCA0A79